MDLSYQSAKSAAETIVLVGAAFMALAYGFKRIYRVARNVEELLSQSAKQQVQRAEIAKALERHIADHDARFAELRHDVAEVVREVRPNGGSSMKDVLNCISARVAALEQRRP